MWFVFAVLPANHTVSANSVIVISVFLRSSVLLFRR